VLQSHTIWLCASCYACTTECPRQIRITDIMYELKQRAIKEKVYPKRFEIPVLAEEFTKMVHDYGRISETWLVSKMYLRTNPLAALGMASLGLGLMKTGRFSLKQDKIERREELAKIMEAVDNEHGKAKA
jgi:quinone-modifying oxidoreductase, subunit QmoC